MRKPVWYESPVDLPECTSGRMSIKHRVVTDRIPLVDMREAVMTGQRATDAMLSKPLRIHELVETFDHGWQVWMSDEPRELRHMHEMLDSVPPKGRVLVGGLGLGVLPTWAAQRMDRPPLVVEISPDVVNLTADKDMYDVQVSNIRDFLQNTDREFDTYYLDTWAGTREQTWWETVLPLRRLIANRWGRKRVACWAHAIMTAQVRISARGQCGEHWYYRLFPRNVSDAAVDEFIRSVGSSTWEKRYGAAYDRLVAESQSRRCHARKVGAS